MVFNGSFSGQSKDNEECLNSKSIMLMPDKNMKSNGGVATILSCFRFIALAMLFLGMMSGMSFASGCGTLPSSIPASFFGCYPSNSVNSQSVATSAGMQLYVTGTPFNALAGNWVAYNTQTGQPYYAWAQSTTSIWVNLGATTIGSASSINGIVAFAIADSSTNLFSSTGYVGECPSCSGTYNALADNGNYVFGSDAYTAGLYDNFYGTSLKSQWYNNGGLTVNNGVTFSETGGANYWLNTTTHFSGTEYTFDWSGTPYTIVAHSAGGCTPNVNNGGWGYSNARLSIMFDNGTGTTCGLGTSATEFYLTSTGYNSGATAAYSSPPSAGIYTTMLTSSHMYALLNYGGTLSAAALPPATGSFGWGVGYGATTITITINYALLRITPPNVVMPTTTIGSLVLSPTISISPNPAAYGQLPITITCTAPSGSSTDTIQCQAPLGTTLCTGTGSCTYTIPNGNPLALGTYTYYVNDITTGATSSSNLIVQKDTPVDVITNVSQGWTSTSGYSTPIIGSFNTYNNILAEQEITGTLSCTGIGTGSTTTSSNSVSFPLSNSIGNFPCTFSTTGSANYNSASATPVDNLVYVPLNCQTASTTYALSPSNTVTQAFSPVNSIWYPLKCYTNSPSSSIFFSLNGILPSAQVLQSGNTISYIPPANLPNYNVWSANLIETQNSNTIWIGVNVNVLNMTDISGAYVSNTMCSTPFQYYADCLIGQYNIFASGAIPSSIGIKSDMTINQYYSTVVANTNTLLTFFNANTTFPLVTYLTYNQFSPAITFTANVLNNPKMTNTFTQGAINYLLSNTMPSNRRVLGNFSVFSQQAFGSVVTNLTLKFNATINHYIVNTIISNTTGSDYYFSIPNSLYLNPNVLQYLNDSASTPLFYFHPDTYCPATIAYPNIAKYPIGLVDTNGTRYTFYISTSGGGMAGGQILQVIEQKGIGTTQVQSYKIPAAASFLLPLEATGQQYAFKVLSSDCTKVLFQSGGLSVPPNPEYITLNTSTSAFIYLISKAAGICQVHNVTNVYNIHCYADDISNIATGYKVYIYNVTSLVGTTKLVDNFTFTGTSFTYNFTLPLNGTYTYAMYSTQSQSPAIVTMINNGYLNNQNANIFSPFLGFIAFIIMISLILGGSATGKISIMLALADLGLVVVGLVLHIPPIVGVIFFLISIIAAWYSKWG